MNYEMNESPRFGSYVEVGTPEIRRQISKEFKTARDSLEMTLDQISAVTKINQRFLKNIEEGRWSFLPPAYVKLFIKAYAEEVGITSEGFETRLENLFKPALAARRGGTDTVSDSSSMPTTGSIRSLAWAQHNRSIIVYSLIIVLAIIAIVIFQSMRDDSDDSDASTINTQDFDITRNDLANMGELETDTANIQPDPVPEPVVLTTMFTIIARDTCYVKIEHSDSTLYERTLWPGNRYLRELPVPLTVKLGRAEGVEVIADGDTLLSYPEGRHYRTLRIGEE